MAKKSRKGNQAGNKQGASTETTEDTLPESELSKQKSQEVDPNPATKPDQSQQNAPQKKVEEPTKDVFLETLPSNPQSKVQLEADHKSSQEQMAISEPAILNFHKLDLKTDPLSIPPEQPLQQAEPHVVHIVPPMVLDQSSTINVLESSLNSLQSLMTEENMNSSKTEGSGLIFISHSKEASERLEGSSDFSALKVEGSIDKQEEQKIQMAQPMERYSDQAKNHMVLGGNLFPMAESDEINLEESQVIQMSKSASSKKYEINNQSLHKEEVVNHPLKEQQVVHVPKEEMVVVLKEPEKILEVKQMENVPQAQFVLSAERQESAISPSVAEAVTHVVPVPETILPVVNIAESGPPHQLISEIPATQPPVIETAVQEVSILQVTLPVTQHSQVALPVAQHPQVTVVEHPQMQRATEIPQQVRDNLESETHSRSSSVHAIQVRQIVESKGYGDPIPQSRWTADALQLEKSVEEVKHTMPHTIATEPLHKIVHKAHHRQLAMSEDLERSEERELERSNCSNAIVEEQRELLLRKEDIGKPLLNVSLILGPLVGIMTYVASKNKLLSVSAGVAIGLATVIYTVVTPTQNPGVAEA